MISAALKTEWLKARKSLTFRMFGIVFILSIIGAIMLIREIDLPQGVISGSPLDAENIYLFAGYAYNWIMFLLGGILAIRLVTSEFSNNTWRAAVMAGAKRWELWVQKLIFISFVSLLASVVFILACTLSSSFYSGFQASLPSLSAVARTVLLSLSYLVFGAMIAWLIRRNTASILVYLGYVLFIEPLLRWWVHGSLITGRHPSMHYYPMNAVEDLFPNPMVLLQDVSVQMGSENEELLKHLILSHSTAMMLSAVFLILFVLISYFAIRNLDL